jgi:hypothetical protein
MVVMVCGKTFVSQAELIRFVQELRSRCPKGERIEGENHLFVLALFRAHPDHLEKLSGRVVSHFTIETHDEHWKKSAPFIVEFTDGSKEHFSFKKSIRNLFERIPTIA